MARDKYDEQLHWLQVYVNPLPREKREMQKLLNDAIERRD